MGHLLGSDFLNLTKNMLIESLPKKLRTKLHVLSLCIFTVSSQFC